MPFITDIEGIEVGHATDLDAITGCTVILCKEGAVGGVDIRGGATGTRELDPLFSGHLVEKVHAILLSGGSAFGLDASGGVMKWLEERGIGFDVGITKVPIVPTAIIFDLWIGNPKKRPDFSMGYLACENATSQLPGEGSVGAGTGATVGKVLGVDHAMKGGIGSWAMTLPGGVKVGALTVVNAWGDVLDPETRQVLVGTRTTAKGHEFAESTKLVLEAKTVTQYNTQNTTLSVIATNALLRKAQASRIATMAQDGLARSISPVHTQFDGDLVFVLSTGKLRADLNLLGVAAAETVSHSITRAVKSAKSLGGIPSWEMLRK